MGRGNRSGLSKSLILKGLQCPRALWLTRNPPDCELPPRPELEDRFRAGTEVGLLARQLFPGGVEVPYEGLSIPAQLARTRELLAAGAAVIYEASFSFSAIFVKVDILVRDGRGENAPWRIYEVKMGTAVKGVNLDDVAVQHYVLNGCGLKVSGSFLVHIDNRYVRRAALEVNKLFHCEDVGARVAARQQSMPEIVSALREALKQPNEPEIDIGPWCRDPYECDFIPWCWRHVPENSIFDLRGSGVDKFDLYRRGILRLADIPLAELNAGQRQQVEATLQRRELFNPAGVREFLATLRYPLYHLDFETFTAPIPKFDGTRPYQQVPFQYSIHLQTAPGSEPQHFEYLAQPEADPRRDLAAQLLAVIPAEACVLVYNQAFEKSVLRDLAAQFPDLAAEINRRIDNLRDLMLPFRRRDVYHWRMRGSYSIKEVLPAMVPGLSYAGMEIADGTAAMQAYHDMCELPPGKERERLRAAMLQYCRLDTLAMVRVLEALTKLAAEAVE